MTSVQVTGQEGVGVLVDAHFRGNVERLLGRDGLRRAAIALVMHSGSTGETTATMVTQGGIVDQRLRRRTGWDVARAVRDRRTVKFVLTGAGFADVGQVDVLALPRVPRAARAAGPERRRDGVEEMTETEASAVGATAIRADTSSLAPTAAETTPDVFECGELNAIYGDMTRAIGAMDRFVYELVPGLDGPPRPGTPRRLRATRRLILDTRGLLLEFGGELELTHNRRC